MTGPLLALDTSTDIGSVAVGEGERLLAEVVLRVGAGHSTALLPAIDFAMRSAGLAPRQLAGVVVGGGPGSFTGLRIGAATAKGMVHALEIPLWSYSGLLAAAAACWGAQRPVCALFDARRRDVYAACYRIGKREEARGKRESTASAGAAVEVLLEPMAFSLDALLDRLRESDPLPLFTGEGAVLHREEIEQQIGAPVAPSQIGIPRASLLLWLQRAAPRLGQVEDPLGWEPAYVRAPGAERIAAARSSPGGATA